MKPRSVSTGSTPVVFDSVFVPLLFGPYAEETGRRLRGCQARNIVEIACGTGATTKALHGALPDAEIWASDLNQRMVDLAVKRVKSHRVHYEVADVLSLPYPHKTFDLAVCNFGFTVFPDKLEAHEEIYRVLKPGGSYLMTTWDCLRRSPAMFAASETLSDFLPAGAPNFLRDVAYAYCDPEVIIRDLANAGFSDVKLETVGLSQILDARVLGEALTLSPPIRCHLDEQPAGTVEAAATALVDALMPWDGKEMAMSAHFATAVR
ncbi:MAG: methyltransferase domain-containing protein [Sphingomicrobium sp.]